MRKLPPVGTRLRWRELAAAWQSDGEAEARLIAAMLEWLPGEKAFLFGSGRAALAALLSALRQFRGGDAVIVPAYTCWSVPAAIVRAGLRVLPVDMKPGDLDYDYEKLNRLDWQGVLAIVSPNLFGLPSDLVQLEGLAEDHGVVLIDDAAQCLGALTEHRPVGSFGVAGILSFGRGKNITALGGGAVIVDDKKLAEALDVVAEPFRSQPAPTHWEVVVKGGAMSLALTPEMYGLAETLPGVTVGKTVYNPQFPTPALGASRAALAMRIWPRLDELNKRRANQVLALDRALSGIRGIVLPRPRSGCQPAWLRRPIMTIETGKRDVLLEALKLAGIGATAMYPAPVASIEELAEHLDRRGEPYDGAKRIADSLIALPLVEGMNELDLQIIVRVVTDVMGRKVGQRWA